MDGRSLKDLHPSLSCGDLENRAAEVGKFWAAPVPAPGKMTQWLQEECTGPGPIYHKHDSFDDNLSSHFTFINVI